MREFISTVEFYTHDIPFSEDAKFPPESNYEVVTGSLYEEMGEEYIYMKREYFDDILDSNVVSVNEDTKSNLTATLNVKLNVDAEIDGIEFSDE